MWSVLGYWYGAVALRDVFSEGSETTEQESKGNLFFRLQEIKGLGAFMCPGRNSRVIRSAP